MLFRKTFAMMFLKTFAVVFNKTIAVMFHKTIAVILVGHRMELLLYGSKYLSFEANNIILRLTI